MEDFGNDVESIDSFLSQNKYGNYKFEELNQNSQLIEDENKSGKEEVEKQLEVSQTIEDEIKNQRIDKKDIRSKKLKKRKKSKKEKKEQKIKRTAKRSIYDSKVPTELFFLSKKVLPNYYVKKEENMKNNWNSLEQVPYPTWKARRFGNAFDESVEEDYIHKDRNKELDRFINAMTNQMIRHFNEPRLFHSLQPNSLTAISTTES